MDSCYIVLSMSAKYLYNCLSHHIGHISVTLHNRPVMYLCVCSIIKEICSNWNLYTDFLVLGLKPDMTHLWSHLSVMIWGQVLLSISYLWVMIRTCLDYSHRPVLTANYLIWCCHEGKKDWLIGEFYVWDMHVYVYSVYYVTYFKPMLN